MYAVNILVFHSEHSLVQLPKEELIHHHQLILRGEHRTALGEHSPLPRELQDHLTTKLQG